MAVEFVAVSNTDYSSRTNVTVAKPTGVADGDLMLAMLTIGNATPPTPTPPSGWTLLSGFPSTVTNSGFSVVTRVYWKVASSEGSDYTWNHATSSSQVAIVAYSGVDTSDPFSAAHTINTGDSQTSTATGLTPDVDGSMIVLLEHDWAGGSPASTPPTGSTPTFTERLDVTFTYIADGILTTAGATGNKSFANSNTAADPFTAVLVALAPVPVDPTGTIAVTDVRDTGALAGDALEPSKTPQNLTATAVSSTAIDLDWDAVSGVTLYVVERDGVIIADDVATNSYSDTGLTPSTEYSYYVMSRL